MAHVAEWKYKYVNDLVDIITKNPVIGIVNIHGIPARQMQAMRDNIRDIMILKGSKNTLIKLALEKASAQGKSGVDSLVEYVDDQCAIVSTELNPFKLFRQFQDTQTPTPAKGGETAHEDILIKKGDTSFKPGPIVSEFQKAGIPAAIERGKIIIKKNVTIVKKGEIISREVAGALTKLEIFPMVVGLNLQAVWEDGILYDPAALDIDQDQILSQFKLATVQALNLAVFSGYTSKQTIVPIIQKAFGQAIGLAVSAGYTTSDTVSLLMAKAQAHMIALANLLDPAALDPDLQNLLSSSMTAAPAVEACAETIDATSEPEEEEEEEEEVTEEDAASGLGSLFD